MDRISRYEMFMRMAEVVALRSTCPRKQVGVVITNAEFTNVVSIGYNGQPRGFPHECRADVPGACGCVHAEVNALIKAPYGQPLYMFSTVAPCVGCARLIVNSGVVLVYYREQYRDAGEGLKLLFHGGIRNVYLNPEA